MQRLATIPALAALILGLTSGSALASSDDFIVNGIVAKDGSWPWQVRLLRSREDATGICGGSLIAARWVLTAAHCVKGLKSLAIGYGSAKLPDLKVIAVDSYVVHPGYRGAGQASDIALVKLSRALENVPVVAIADTSLDGRFNIAGAKLTVTGWGATYDYKHEEDLLELYTHLDPTALGTIMDSPRVKIPKDLRQADIEVFDFDTCKKAYATIPGHNYSIDDTEICAGIPGAVRDSCYGDSGGPLMARDDRTGSYVQLGIVSWGYQCGHPMYPGVYARVASFHDWVTTTMSDD